MADRPPLTAKADTEAFVSQAYRQLLGREPDESGLRMFTTNLLAGRTRDELVQVIVESPEYAATPPSARERFLADHFLYGEHQSRFSDETASAKFPIDYQPPGEAGRCYLHRLRTGFLDKYCSGDVVLDVGFSGYDNPEGKTAIPGAIGIDLDYPGYDGIRLPFDDSSVDTVFSSHCLEHIHDDIGAIRDWHRVLKVGGFIVCMVPHQALYEKKTSLPSRWNADHKRMYTVASLMESFERALAVNSYRLRHLAENDRGFNYALGPDQHSDGAYEIELVIEKIQPPAWDLADA